jgi:hypothetical protein
VGVPYPSQLYILKQGVYREFVEPMEEGKAGIKMG